MIHKNTAYDIIFNRLQGKKHYHVRFKEDCPYFGKDRPYRVAIPVEFQIVAEEAEKKGLLDPQPPEVATITTRRLIGRLIQKGIVSRD